MNFSKNILNFNALQIISLLSFPDDTQNTHHVVTLSLLVELFTASLYIMLIRMHYLTKFCQNIHHKQKPQHGKKRSILSES